MRVVRLSNGLAAARAHLRYIERGGVQRDGSRGHAYSAQEDHADAKSFIERCSGDRHQFRLITSPEDGVEYEDLKPLVRRFMGRVEKDLGSYLEWFAVDHFDTTHPHTHLILRGRDDRGDNLVIAREYLCHGMRERLAEIVTLDLGPRYESQVERKLRQEVLAEHLTRIDRAFVGEMDVDHTIQGGHPDGFRHALRIGRLNKLEALGLAEPLPSGRWCLAPHLEETLRRLGERRAIARMIGHELKAHAVRRSPAQWVISQGPTAAGLVGRLIASAISDELAGRHHLLVDGLDGRVHFVDLGSRNSLEPLPDNAVLRVSASSWDLGSSGAAEIGEATRVCHSWQVRQSAHRGASSEFIKSHGHSPEGGPAAAAFENLRENSWFNSPKHVEHVLEVDGQEGTSFLRIEILSPLPLERLPHWNGPTWLDQNLAGGEPQVARDSGFGHELRLALALRRQWLLEQQLATERGGGKIVLIPGALAELRERELRDSTFGFTGELGKRFVPAVDGEPVSGVFKGRVDLPGGRYALVENAHEFTLVPWHRPLEQRLGRDVEGVMRSEPLIWRFGRGRSGPQI